MTKKEAAQAELRGAAKMLDILWEGSYYRCGKENAVMIESWLINLLGKNWSKTMYNFVGKNGGARLEPPQSLREVNKL